MRELTISLNAKAETPLYEQIYHYIKQDIQEHKILAGEKLPSSCCRKGMWSLFPARAIMPAGLKGCII